MKSQSQRMETVERQAAYKMGKIGQTLPAAAAARPQLAICHRLGKSARSPQPARPPARPPHGHEMKAQREKVRKGTTPQQQQQQNRPPTLCTIALLDSQHGPGKIREWRNRRIQEIQPAIVYQVGLLEYKQELFGMEPSDACQFATLWAMDRTRKDPTWLSNTDTFCGFGAARASRTKARNAAAKAQKYTAAVSLDDSYLDNDDLTLADIATADQVATYDLYNGLDDEIAAALDRLPANHATAFRMMQVYGQTSVELSAKSDTTPAVWRKWNARARTALKKDLAAHNHNATIPSCPRCASQELDVEKTLAICKTCNHGGKLADFENAARSPYYVGRGRGRNANEWTREKDAEQQIDRLPALGPNIPTEYTPTIKDLGEWQPGEYIYQHSPTNLLPNHAPAYGIEKPATSQQHIDRSSDRLIVSLPEDTAPIDAPTETDIVDSLTIHPPTRTGEPAIHSTGNLMFLIERLPDLERDYQKIKRMQLPRT